MITNPKIISMTDLRTAGCCPSGIRQWFLNHDIDYKKLVNHTLTTEEFLSKGDGHSDRIVAVKRQREQEYLKDNNITIEEIREEDFVL